MYKKCILASPVIVSALLLNASLALAQTPQPSSGGLVSPSPSSSSFVSSPPPVDQHTSPNTSPAPQGGQIPPSGIGPGAFDQNRSGQGFGGTQGPQGQFQGDPNRAGGQQFQQFHDQNRQHDDSNRQEFQGRFHDQQRDGADSREQQQEQQEQQQMQMLKNAQSGLTVMQRMIGGMEKRMASIEKKGGIISAALKSSIQQVKDLMSRAQGASTMDEFQGAGLEDMRDLMQTINDEMQKAEMSTQFPAMLKQAKRILAGQQKILGSAQKKAASLKVSVDSLLASWKSAVDAMSQGVNQAEQSFQAGNTEEAVAALKDNVFDAMQTTNDYRQTFEMIANSQKMLASAGRELASIEKKIASLKKQGKDTADAEAALSNAKDKIQAVKDAIAQASIDPDTLISTIQDAQDAKEELYNEMYDLTGQAQYNQPFQQSVPGLTMQQFQAPPGMQHFFGGPQQQQQQGENGQGGSGQPGNSGGFPRPAGGPQSAPSPNQGGGFQQTPGGSGGSLPSFGPQGFNYTGTSSAQAASVLESMRKQIEELRARVQETAR